MSKKFGLHDATSYLFGCDFFDDDFDPEGKEEHLECAEELLSSYSFNDIFAEWNKYLHDNCKTSEDVINFCNLFAYYGGQDYYIPEAYDFVGYIYYMVDIEREWDNVGDFLDGFCNAILERAGKISLSRDPYYQSWKDPKVLAVIAKYKKGSNLH